jgi:hypothetical protein
VNPRTLAFAAVFSAAVPFATVAQAEEKEPIAIFEIGGAGNWTAPNAASVGPTVAVEFTPIKDWLEIEIGTGPLFASGTTDWSTDILFKKPFELSNTAELMVGAGPAFDSTFGGTTKIGVEFALDFMFWPWPDRKYGWFLEPSYTYSFINGREQSLGVSAGLLIAIR